MQTDIEHIVAIYAAVIATVTMMWNIAREFRDHRRKEIERTKLRLHMDLVTYHNRPDGRMFRMLPLYVSNLGREPVIISHVLAWGPGCLFQPGAFAEPAAAYGIRERLLPRKVEPGETAEISLFTIGLFRTAFTNLCVTDSDGRDHELSQTLLDELRQRVLPLLAQEQV